jgi:hypothetical protein
MSMLLGQGRRQIRWPTRVIPLSVISEGNDHMDAFSHINADVLSIFVCDTLFLGMDHLRNLLRSSFRHRSCYFVIQIQMLKGG